ncbi:MAG: hydroxyisourate hydrolase [Myxococcales bacterium]|nr:hydroxyisourate hydrolase [Myxococcales bacterium]
MKSPITTHVLDTALGKPAAGMSVLLEQLHDDHFHDVGEGVTNDDGRVLDLMEPGSLEEGMYRLSFDVESYFERLGVASFYPLVTIDFEVTNAEEHYHVPLLLSPYGYSTYRGS